MCHQTVSLVARHLEANGIPTVIVGSARDIVEQAGVARFLFVDYPLGNSTGRPGEVAEQATICGQAIDLLERAWQPRTTVQSNMTWGSDEWRANYMRVDDTNRARLAAAGAARRDEQASAKADGRARTS